MRFVGMVAHLDRQQKIMGKTVGQVPLLYHTFRHSFVSMLSVVEPQALPTAEDVAQGVLIEDS